MSDNIARCSGGKSIVLFEEVEFRAGGSGDTKDGHLAETTIWLGKNDGETRRAVFVFVVGDATATMSGAHTYSGILNAEYIV